MAHICVYYFIIFYPTFQYFYLLLDTILIHAILTRRFNMKENKDKPLKEKVSITLDSDLVQKIKDMADNDDRSFSQYINRVLKEHVSNLETKGKTTRRKGATH